jgi:hypothetical protein
MVFETGYTKRKGRAFATVTQLRKFATDALNLLKMRCPRTIFDGGLNRVDIMCLSSGQMVVNEFESLEACYAGGECDTLYAQRVLQEYWLRKLNRILLFR